jgi:hypothetical protein
MEHGSLASKFLPSRKAREAPLLVWRTSRAYRPIHYRPCAHPLPNRSSLSASPHSSRPSKESATLSPPDRERACNRSPFPSCPKAIYAPLRYMRKPEETTRRERGSVEAGKKPPFVHDQPSAGWAEMDLGPGRVGDSAPARRTNKLCRLADGRTPSGTNHKGQRRTRCHKN